MLLDRVNEGNVCPGTKEIIERRGRKICKKTEKWNEQREGEEERK